MSGSDIELLPGLIVSRETNDTLRAFVALIEKWNTAINLISRSSAAEAWTRHLLDSAQIFPLAPDSARTWADLGSGGGFPGIIVAILSKELRPDCRTILVESDLRKATFLGEAIRTFGLNAQVLPQRIDAIAPLECDVISARALASLDKLLPFALRHLKTDGCALFLKGKSFEQELDVARIGFRFQAEKFTSGVEDSSAVLRIQNIERIET